MLFRGTIDKILFRYLKFEDIRFYNLSEYHYNLHDKQSCIITGLNLKRITIVAKKTQSQWASGPAEILKHAMSLLYEESETNRRLAMLLIDNAIEQIAKTYLSLPKRITGIKISRKRLQEILESFPALLDAIEELAFEKLDGVDLGAIEWYHRLRNELYHQGMGLTVERDKVDTYAELARMLFKNLFGEDLDVPLDRKAECLGLFTQGLTELESILESLAKKVAKAQNMQRTEFPDPAMILFNEGVISKDMYDEITYLRGIRNSFAYSETECNEVITDYHLSILYQTIGFIKMERDRF